MTASNDCQQVQELLPDYLDNGLSQQQSQWVSVHLQQCETCRKAGQQRPAADNAKLNADAQARDKLLNDSGSAVIQSIGWIAIVCAIIIIVSLVVPGFWTNDALPWQEKLSIALLCGGAIALFITVLRQRLIARKTDKYNKVKL